jgi:roadblock/LC7 domain-containing protein
MSSIRRPVTLVLASTAAVVYAACSSGSYGGSTTASGACSDVCNKQEACGDIDSVAATQCNTKCSADAQQINAVASTCLNESDILYATEQCLARACPDYAACLTTLPACLTGGTGGTTTTSGTGGTGTGGGTTTGTMPTGVACTETSGSFTVCIVYTSGVSECPPNTTQLPSNTCPTANELGYCTVSDGGTSGDVYFYSTGGFTASQAQSLCMGQGGTWTPA